MILRWAIKMRDSTFYGILVMIISIIIVVIIAATTGGGVSYRTECHKHGGVLVDSQCVKLEPITWDK